MSNKTNLYFVGMAHLKSSDKSLANKGGEPFQETFFSRSFPSKAVRKGDCQETKTATRHNMAWVNVVRQRHPLSIFFTQIFCLCFYHRAETTDASVMRQQTLMQYMETNLNVLPTSRLHLYGTHHRSTRQSWWQEGIFLSRCSSY